MDKKNVYLLMAKKINFTEFLITNVSKLETNVSVSVASLTDTDYATNNSSALRKADSEGGFWLNITAMARIRSLVVSSRICV